MKFLPKASHIQLLPASSWFLAFLEMHRLGKSSEQPFLCWLADFLRALDVIVFAMFF